MSVYFELAYAAASNRLCLFTGTGFSKAVTENKAPGWQKLLEDCCLLLKDGMALKDQIFPSSGKYILTLEEAAQVIEIELRREGKSLHEEVANMIGKLVVSGDNSNIEHFIHNHSIRVVTTNYDKLMERFAKDPQDVLSICPGLPIPRSTASMKVYHVHGSVDSAQNMILTSEDYFRFLNSSSYFSEKLSTVLHENTVVILGYSLGDTNLKAILSSYRSFLKTHACSSNIFFVSKDQISRQVKEYYSHCYGIRVIDNTNIHKFFEQLNTTIKTVSSLVSDSRKHLDLVLNHGHSFVDDFIKMEDSFFQIHSSVAAIGKTLKDPKVVEVMGNVIDKKREFTRISGAWEQYSHLASWLVYLGSLVDLENSSIKDKYLQAALHSMNNMSEAMTLGSSWHAFKTWKNGWLELTFNNRMMLKEFIEKSGCSRDALKVIYL